MCSVVQVNRLRPAALLSTVPARSTCRSCLALRRRMAGWQPATTSALLLSGLRGKTGGPGRQVRPPLQRVGRRSDLTPRSLSDVLDETAAVRFEPPAEVFEGQLFSAFGGILSDLKDRIGGPA